MARFEFDQEFEENVKKASYKSGSSLRPLFDQVRKVTDNIARDAKQHLQREAGVAESETQNARGDYSRSGRKSFLRAKAKASALRTAANSTVPVMGYDGVEIFGRVLINRADSQTIEFGGTDPKAEIGRGTGEYVEHPPYAPLRRAMDRSAG